MHLYPSGFNSFLNLLCYKQFPTSCKGSERELSEAALLRICSASSSWDCLTNNMQAAYLSELLAPCPMRTHRAYSDRWVLTYHARCFSTILCPHLLIRYLHRCLQQPRETHSILPPLCSLKWWPNCKRIIRCPLWAAALHCFLTCDWHLFPWPKIPSFTAALV